MAWQDLATRFRSLFALILAGAILIAHGATAAEEPLKVGSKRFTESYILGEILAQTANQAEPATHLAGLGNTAILLAALRQGRIDLYPEYSGTIALEILRHEGAPLSLTQMNEGLAALGLGAAVPFGFENSYALATTSALASSAHLSSMDDLKGHDELRLGLSHEFLGRADGWPGLAAAYHLSQQPVGLDHGLAYEALASGQVSLIDIYTTDAKINQYHLVTLSDPRHYFPRYDALILYRLDVPARHPRAWAALGALANSISVERMINMNAAAELSGQPFTAIAHDFIHGHVVANASDAHARPGVWARLTAPDLWTLTLEHLFLVLSSVLAAIAIGLPLGILAYEKRLWRAPVLVSVGLLQTIPSLALLAFLIPLVGRIGTVPALIALFLYAMLPIVRNTATGLGEVGAGLREAATALGLGWFNRMRYIELPLAAQTILAGIKTSTIIAVGTATLAALIGAGGFGQRISVGLALNDNAMLLAGAIPAALLALCFEVGFVVLDRLMFRHRRQA